MTVTPRPPLFYTAKAVSFTGEGAMNRGLLRSLQVIAVLGVLAAAALAVGVILGLLEAVEARAMAIDLALVLGVVAVAAALLGFILRSGRAP